MDARRLPRILASGATPLALAACLASCGTTGAVRAADPEPVAAPPRDRTPDRPPEPPPAPPAPDPCPGGGCASLRFFRPAGCSTPVRSGWRRVVRECASEERLEVLVRPDGSIATRPLPPGPSRAPYPVELARQWRRCETGLGGPQGFDPHGLDPARFGRYEDPEVGPCLVLRDLDPARVAAARKPARLSLLDDLHPVIAEATTRLVLAAEEKGIRVKVISGLRPYTKKVVSAWKTVKGKDGTKKRVKYRKTVHRKGLH
ncbi:MAG: hypothetical protein FJ087_19550, partial [Deltaproteobacteria bacterium]|nr:hypothetical protein [Deltaproteobacteria bacterium]